MAQGEPFGGAVGPAEPVDQGLLQSALGGLGAGGTVEPPAQHLSGAAIEGGNERVPPPEPTRQGAPLRSAYGLGLLHTLVAGFHSFGSLLPVQP